MIKKNLLKEAWVRLTRAHSFVLACHVSPDGDALGSALALAHVLKQQGKDAVVVAQDGVPDNCKGIPELETVVKCIDRRDFDIGILVDSEDPERVGNAAEVIKAAQTAACIDHHVPGIQFGEIRVSDTSASSTAEIIYELFEANSIAIDEVAAWQLLFGIIWDTGGLKFPNTTPRTLEIAARLQELGANHSVIMREILDNRSMRAMKMLGIALASLQEDPSGLVVWAVVTKQDMDSIGASDEDTDSIVNQVGRVAGPKAYILFRELEPEAVRVSLRARGGVDMNQVAKVFGGGGHVAAAGCTVRLPLDAAVKRVIEEVLKWMVS